MFFNNMIINKISDPEKIKKRNINKLYEEKIRKEMKSIVMRMRIKDDEQNNEKILKKINQCKSLTEKCIYVREYLKPQSTIFQKIIMNDLKIHQPVDEISGDGCKNGIHYEIKTSIHSKGSKINFVQIRPDHHIDYYILISYNLYDMSSQFGKAYIFKIPSSFLYELIIKYGGYAHGTRKKLGEISIHNIKGNNYEYAIRCDPNKKNGKNYDIWKELLKFEVNYNENEF